MTSMRLAAAALAAAAPALAPGHAAAQGVVTAPVVVSPNRTPTEAARTGSAVTVIEREEIERLAGERTLGDVLARQPGMVTTRNGPPGAVGSITLRGLPGRYVQVRIDGIELTDPAQPQGGAVLQTITPFDLGRVELLRGSQSALYGGDAVAGVIDISTLRATEDGLSATLFAEGGSFMTAAGSAGVTGRSEAGEFALTASGLDTDGYSAADENAGNREEDGSRLLTLSATGALYATETLEIGGALRYSDAEVEFDPTFPALADGATLDQLSETRSLGARAYARFELLGATHEISAQHFLSERESRDAGIVNRFDGDRTKLEWLGEAPLAPFADLQFGADWTTEAIDTDNGFGTLLEESADMFGGFVQLTLQPVESLTLAAAIRHDEHAEFGGFTTGRATAAWRVAEGTKLRASVANGFRPPALDELYNPGYGNPNLDPETSISFDAGIEQSLLDGRARLELGVFHIVREDPIVFDPTFTYTQGTSDYTSQGVELAARIRPVEGLELSAAYTFTDADCTPSPTDFGCNQQGRILRSAEHALSGSLAWAATDRLTLGATALFVSGLVDGNAFDADTETYLRLDARADYRLTDRASVFVRAVNLLDQEYQTVDGYGTPDLSAFAGLRVSF